MIHFLIEFLVKVKQIFIDKNRYNDIKCMYMRKHFNTVQCFPLTRCIQRTHSGVSGKCLDDRMPNAS